MFLFASRTDTFGQVLLEAQASGLPVVAVGEGGPLGLVDDGETGLLRPADPLELANAVVAVAKSEPLRSRLRRGALAALRERTWEASLERLAAGYDAALAGGIGVGRQVA